MHKRQNLEKKLEAISDILVKAYISLFIFCMVNREFLLSGLDLRYIVVPLGILLIVYYIISNHGHLNLRPSQNSKQFKLLLVFYLWAFLCNISWFWNGLAIRTTPFCNELILLANIFISILVIKFYEDKISANYIRVNIIVSTIILVTSMILVSIGLTNSQISMSLNVPSEYISKEATDIHTNLFGWNFRPAGYASDPNYASVLMLIAGVCVANLDIKKRQKATLLAPFLLGLALAFSKTVIIAMIFTIVLLSFLKYVIKKQDVSLDLLKTFIIALIIFNALAPFIPFLRENMPQTITTRLSMWQNSDELFLHSPLIGNGITSFRSFFATNHWYVQDHSTYLQILSEMGLVGIILFYLIFSNALRKNYHNKTNLFLIIVFMIFMLTNETIALQFFIFPTLLCMLDDRQPKTRFKQKKALFMINGLSNGGAERVCINLADELLRRKYQVDFILLGDNQGSSNYRVNPRINVINLDIYHQNKLKRIFGIISAAHKVNKIIEQNEMAGEYDLITSHLPMSNILTLLSIAKSRSLYVFHTDIAHYFPYNILPVRIFLKTIFFHKKIVTVSEGLKRECVNDYKMNKNYIKTIYNPIDIQEIHQKMMEPINIQDKYLLQVGRFSSQKGQDKMIKIYKEGNFSHNYKLVFCGAGETQERCRRLAEKLGIADSVVFLGWQNNIYKWMKNAELLVCTSEREAFPMALVEAFACNTKAVSADCAFGPSEILVGDFASYLVKSDQNSAYIEKINLALRTYPKKKNPILQECAASNIVKNYLDFSAKDFFTNK